MVIIPSPYTFISFDVTATSDAVFRLTSNEIQFHEINIHVYTQDCIYGSGSVTSAIAPAGSVLSFRNGDLSDLWFKNRNAGNNTQIVLVATIDRKE